jgi:hypothetical protein
MKRGDAIARPTLGKNAGYPASAESTAVLESVADAPRSGRIKSFNQNAPMKIGAFYLFV